MLEEQNFPHVDNFVNIEDGIPDQHGYLSDRRDQFVIDDNEKLSPHLFQEPKPLRSSFNCIGERRMTAIAVRENGASKFSKALRFMHILPAFVSKDFSTWIGIPKPGMTDRRTLYSKSDDKTIEQCETLLNAHCIPLTMW